MRKDIFFLMRRGVEYKKNFLNSHYIAVKMTSRIAVAFSPSSYIHPPHYVAHILTIQIRDTFEYILLRACAWWRRHDKLYLYIYRTICGSDILISVKLQFCLWLCVCVCVSCLCINKVFFSGRAFCIFHRNDAKGTISSACFSFLL